jgi:hypothetical protein
MLVAAQDRDETIAHAARQLRQVLELEVEYERLARRHREPVPPPELDEQTEAVLRRHLGASHARPASGTPSDRQRP